MEYYLTRIARVFEKYPQIAGKCTLMIEGIGRIISDSGWGEVVAQIKEHTIHKLLETLSKK